MSAPLVKIAIASIALGVLVMVMSVCILRGFQNEITRKVAGFGSHIVVQNITIGQQFEETPLSTQRDDLARLRNLLGISHIQFFATKGGMAKTNDQIHGVIFRGVSRGFDSTFLVENIVDGRLFRFADSTASNEVIISQTIANKLQLNVGDKMRTYFWQGANYRARAFSIVGIYNTDLSDFDEHYVIGDIAQVQRLNGWQADHVGGYELLIDDFDKIDRVAAQALSCLNYDLALTTVIQQHQALFAWLSLLDSNIVLIIIIMALVCIVAIISALLIMIFEKASTIGLLKVLGATNQSIRRIFLIKSMQIITLGILIGDGIALLLCFLEQRYHLITLDSETYSMSFVPVAADPWIFILISLGSLAACMAALLIPASYISRVVPAKSLRFE